MRRAFVIFLILLFPLNVFALSMSVASVQQATDCQAGLSTTAGDTAGDSTAAFEYQATGDVDSDEPPSGTDFHDSVNAAKRLHGIVLPDESICSHLPSRHGLAPHPPIKPPPVH